MFSATVRERLIDGLEGTPGLLEYVLAPIPADDPSWDCKDGSGDYTLREALAHLADWDPIWLERMRLTAGGTEPNLKAYIISQRAAELDYAHADPRRSLAQLATSRPQMAAFLRGLTGPEWRRVAFHPEEGRQSIETQVAWVLAHDDYYVKRVVHLLNRSLVGA